MSGLHSFASSSAQHPKFDVALFIFQIDLLLVFIFALYVVSTLPRALVCWFHPSESLNGIFLRSGGRCVQKERRNNTSTFSNVDLLRSAISSSYGSVCTLIRISGNDKSSSIYSPPITPLARSPRKPSRCVPRWTTILHPGPALAYALNVRISPGFSFVKLLVLFIYSAVILYACLFRSNPITDPVREGFVAVSQIPIIVALAGKTNCLSWLCGVGYEKVYIDYASPDLCGS
jgi:ferric-chelate reductase